MVFIKRIDNPLGDTGSSTQVGTDHWDWLDKYHDNVDVTSFTGKPATINTPTEYRDQILSILNAGSTAKYTWKAGTISSDVDLSLPDLAGDATLVAAGGANDWGDAAQTFRSTYFVMRNPANSNSYIHVTSAIVANRIVTWPLLTSDDEVMFKSFSQTPINKTININQNTIKHSSSNGQGDILRYDSSYGGYIKLTKGTANQVLHVKADATDIEWAAESGSLAADKIKVYEGGSLVGTIARKLNFNSTHFNCTDDTINDEIDIDLASPGGGSGNAVTIYKNTATVSVANTSTETNVISQSISAGSMGTTGLLHLVISGHYLNDSGASESFDIRLKFGGTTIWEDTSESFSDHTIRRTFHMEFFLKNNNSATAQKTTGWYMFGLPSNAPFGFSDFSVVTTNAHGTMNAADSSINTVSAQTLALSIQHSDTDALLQFNADTVFLELIA